MLQACQGAPAMSLDGLRLDGVRLAVFDVDHTVVNGTTALWFGYYLARRGQLPWSTLIRGAVWATQHRAGMIDTETVFQSSAKAFGGMSMALIEEMTKESFERYVRPRIYADAREIVTRCEARGIATLLLSASGYQMVQEVGRELGIADLIGNHLEVEDGMATGRLLRPYAYGIGKLRFLEEFIAARSISLGECAGFADSYSDAPLLRAMGFPHAVNADRRLRREARTRSWSILDLE